MDVHRPKYGLSHYSTQYKQGRTPNLDSSIDSSERSDASSLQTSVHKFIKHPRDEESAWPVPNSPDDFKRVSDRNYDDDSDSSENPLLSCLCSGVELLGSILCQIYSENDKHKEVQLRRAPSNLGAKLKSVSRLLNTQMSNELYSMIPETARVSMPRLVFATYKDGWSMENLLAKTRDLDPVIILIRALKTKVIIGAFSTAKLSPPSTRVRGNGECFVFRLSQPSVAYRWTYIPSVNKKCQNQFVVSSREYIAFGASAEHGTNALRLDGDLRTCDSGFSDTFQSDPLAPEEAAEGGVLGPFEVEDIEILHVADNRRRQRRYNS
mmetsp:Transcript_3097/g.4765  ORF Transcript_3097/g.4765 Transcript_3097/m.4765 type:complete len:323 (-) Transcript_3097:247-1215(-)|eukprot:CAMPEP_0185033780 /NCGR_PEP_ID=MMETSP1103-20130426/23086_1 /TAXON_ID=36769 /ORGANISM="Paraphysomonas bandaiensis, Strain Caron Lab Isolate" /LENGTH=322 /DNA_ID=CAMNT_0027570181 /DNA_START=153 /DNA_END=1121 /DNA_ORIENTATION=-